MKKKYRGRFQPGHDPRRFAGRTDRSHKLTTEERQRGYLAACAARGEQWVLTTVRKWYEQRRRNRG